MESLLQSGEGSLPIGRFRIRTQRPIEAGHDQLLERDPTLGGNDFRAVKKVFGKVNGCLHQQYIRLYGHTVNQAWSGTMEIVAEDESVLEQAARII